MKLPYSWLKDFTDVGIHNVSAKQYAAEISRYDDYSVMRPLDNAHFE